MPRWIIYSQWSVVYGFVLFSLMACVDNAPISEEWTRCREQTDRFVVSDNGTVQDTCTQLMWMAQDYRNIESKPLNRWADAMAWVDTINQQRYGGYGDWRAPSRAEYKTIYDPEKPSRSFRGNPVGYPAAFAEGGGIWLWTGEVSAYGSSGRHVHDAWSFNFVKGKALPVEAYSYAHGITPGETTGSMRLVRQGNRKPQ